MFDKNQQRRLAQEADLRASAQGEKKPNLEIPKDVLDKLNNLKLVSRTRVWKDKLGNTLNVGDRVVRASSNRGHVEIRTIAKITDAGVFLENSKVSLNYPSRVVKL